MKLLRRIISIAFAVLIVVVAVYNRQPVSVHLPLVESTLRELPLSLYILGALFFGIVVGYGIATMHRIKQYYQVRELQDKVKTLEQSLFHYEQERTTIDDRTR